MLQLLTDRERQILAYLGKHPGKSAFQISVDLKVTQSTVYKALNRLARENLVRAERTRSSETWNAASQKEFREIYTKEIEKLVDQIYG